MAYGLDKTGGDRKIAVYDLGGGTFDVSIIEIAEIDNERQFEVLSTNGDTFLGGEDFDALIIHYFADEFLKETGVDVRKDPLAMQRLKEAAEKAKIEAFLQPADRCEPAVHHGGCLGSKHLNVKITRAKLESLVEGLVKRTIEPCRVALKDAGLTADEVGEVILVGGQTRMPLVQKYVKEFFGKEPRRDVNPGRGGRRGRRHPGRRAVGRSEGRAAAGRHAAVAGHRDPRPGDDQAHREEHHLPTRASQVFSTADDNQTAVTIHVLQGERERSGDNKSLGRFDLTDIKPAPRGMPQVEVSFDIDANGILNVSAKDKSTGKEQKIIIKASSGLSEDEIKRMVTEAEAHADEDRRFRELVESRNRADGLLHATERSLSELGEKISGSDRATVESALNDLRTAIKATTRTPSTASPTRW